MDHRRQNKSIVANGFAAGTSARQDSPMSCKGCEERRKQWLALYDWAAKELRMRGVRLGRLSKENHSNAHSLFVDRPQADRIHRPGSADNRNQSRSGRAN